ncbi:MAG: hypothetical protein MJ086_03450 [Lachnospiraceae bacterium]|nr:hypothetical protein [Lachnospiraceae bacterium]
MREQLPKELEKELKDELIKIYDDKDFIFCIFNGLTKKTATIMLDFIKTAKLRNENVSHDDIVALSLVLERENKI